MRVVSVGVACRRPVGGPGAKGPEASGWSNARDTWVHQEVPAKLEPAGEEVAALVEVGKHRVTQLLFVKWARRAEQSSA
jgi:hypothetical protein